MGNNVESICMSYYRHDSSDRAMDLTLSLQNSPGAGLLWCGISGKQIGRLEPKAAVVIDFNLLATKPGLQVSQRNASQNKNSDPGLILGLCRSGRKPWISPEIQGL